jgi:hypothetical protein
MDFYYLVGESHVSTTKENYVVHLFIFIFYYIKYLLALPTTKGKDIVFRFIIEYT